MKRFSISFFAAAAVLAAATSMLQSQPLSIQAHGAGLSNLLEMQSGLDLPNHEFEDRSLVFPQEVQS